MTPPNARLILVGSVAKHAEAPRRASDTGGARPSGERRVSVGCPRSALAASGGCRTSGTPPPGPSSSPSPPLAAEKNFRERRAMVERRRGVGARRRTRGGGAARRVGVGWASGTPRPPRRPPGATGGPSPPRRASTPLCPRADGALQYSMGLSLTGPVGKRSFRPSSPRRVGGERAPWPPDIDGLHQISTRISFVGPTRKKSFRLNLPLRTSPTGPRSERGSDAQSLDISLRFASAAAAAAAWRVPDKARAASSDGGVGCC